VLCLDTDRVCSGCGGSLRRGLSPAKLANFTGILFAVLMMVFVVVYQPSPLGTSNLREAVANSLAAGIFIGGGYAVGVVIGWVLGLFGRLFIS
jgi:hypothetical protein